MSHYRISDGDADFWQTAHSLAIGNRRQGFLNCQKRFPNLRMIRLRLSLHVVINPHSNMSASPFQDPRANDLLSRVSEDVSLLRQDIGHLFSHTARHTLPSGARDLAETARNRLSAGRDYSAAQLRVLRDQVNQPATAWIGGAVVVGLIAAGIYWFCKSDCCQSGQGCCDEDDQDRI